MKNKTLGIIFVLIFLAAVVSLVCYWEIASQTGEFNPFPAHHLKSNTLTYVNNEFGFIADYDRNYAVDTSGQQVNFFKHAAKSLASVSIPQSLYPKTNFGSAQATIAVQPESQQSTCEAGGESEKIDGVVFHESEQDGAAAGTRYQSKIYRTFRNQTCYEVSLTTGIANIANFDPGAVTEVDENDIWTRLNQVLDSFRFTDADSPTSSTGTLAGHVTIGPNCPVERVDRPCEATPQAYMSRQVGVFTQATASTPEGQDNARLITSQHLDGNGNYHFDLEPGKYTVKASGMIVSQLNTVVGTVTITAHKTTTLNFDIDTGIR